jgi:hypothetical protein
MHDAATGTYRLQTLSIGRCSMCVNHTAHDILNDESVLMAYLQPIEAYINWQVYSVCVNHYL